MASSMEATDMNARIDKIERELNTLSADISQDDAARKKLMAISGKLTTTLEAPGEAIWRIMMQVNFHFPTNVYSSMVMLTFSL